MEDIGQQNDFLMVIEANKGLIYKVANSFCKETEDRKDLFQEITMKLWKSFGSYNEDYKLSTWIYKIALNTAISFYRKEKTRKNKNAPLPENILEITDFQDNSQKEQGSYFLFRFISELKELDRALILLYLEEKSHREIAEIIGISESNVATKLGRIKSILKQKFSQISI